MTTAPVVPTGPSANATGAPGTAKTSGLAIAGLVAGTQAIMSAGSRQRVRAADRKGGVLWLVQLVSSVSFSPSL